MKGAQAFVTTRHFQPVFHHTDELDDPVIQKELARSLSDNELIVPKCFVYLNQVHGAHVGIISDKRFLESHFTRLEKTDAAITNVPDLGLIVMTADCLSVFFHAGSWVGAAHAGWRGTKDGIARKTLEAIVETSGIRVQDVKILFGPCIRGCHYEVGPELKSYFSAESFVERGGKLFFNLSLENKRQLLAAGACEKNFADMEACTVCDNQDYYSYRLEGARAGRMLSIISRR